MSRTATNGPAGEFGRPKDQDGVHLREERASSRRSFQKKQSSRPLVVFALLVAGLFGAGLGTAAAQSITGTLTTGLKEAIGPTEGIHVTVFDSVNAQILARAIAASNSIYGTADIPTGAYRIRFSDSYVAGLPVSYFPKFFGTGGDNFCAGAVVGVVGGKTVTVSDQIQSVPIEPEPAADSPRFFTYTVSGKVMDAGTLAPLPGIQVRILGADNAMPLSTAATDNTGRWDATFGTHKKAIKVRFSDPSNAYSPRFFGDRDSNNNFCSAPLLSLSVDLTELDQEYLVRISPEQWTRKLADRTQHLSLPGRVSAVLDAPLTLAVKLLADGKTSHDSRACGQLALFIRRVNNEKKNGHVTPADAESLRQSAEAALTDLGCK